MKKRILSLALALALILSLSLSLAAPVSAANDGWNTLTVVDDYTTVVFSAAKTWEATVKIEDESGIVSKKAVIVTVPSGSSISVKINESIADCDESTLVNLLAMGLLGSWDDDWDNGNLPKAADLVGRECHRNIQHFYEEEDGTLSNEGFDYFISSGPLKLQKPVIPALNGDDGKLYLLYAAEDWAPLSFTADFVDVMFSEAKVVEGTVKHWVDANGSDFAQWDDEYNLVTTGMTQEDWNVTHVLLRPDSDVTITFNENVLKAKDVELLNAAIQMALGIDIDEIAKLDLNTIVGKEAVAPMSAYQRADGAYVHSETWWTRPGKAQDSVSGVYTIFATLIEGDDGSYLIQVGAVTFPDVPASAWYADEVDYVVGNGLMKGSDDGRFKPLDTITRAEVAQILYNRADAPGAGSAVFSDVPSSEWYYAAVTWAADQGLVQGSGGAFAPGKTITREQLAIMLYNTANKPAADLSVLNARPDGGKVSDWAKTQMAWAVESGIITGDTSGNLNPQGTASRAEVATMVQRFCEKYSI